MVSSKDQNKRMVFNITTIHKGIDIWYDFWMKAFDLCSSYLPPLSYWTALCAAE